MIKPRTQLEIIDYLINIRLKTMGISSPFSINTKQLLTELPNVRKLDLTKTISCLKTEHVPIINMHAEMDCKELREDKKKKEKISILRKTVIDNWIEKKQEITLINCTRAKLLEYKRLLYISIEMGY